MNNHRETNSGLLNNPWDFSTSGGWRLTNKTNYSWKIFQYHLHFTFEELFKPLSPFRKPAPRVGKQGVPEHPPSGSCPQSLRSLASHPAAHPSPPSPTHLPIQPPVSPNTHPPSHPPLPHLSPPTHRSAFSACPPPPGPPTSPCIYPPLPKASAFQSQLGRASTMSRTGLPGTRLPGRDPLSGEKGKRFHQ